MAGLTALDASASDPASKRHRAGFTYVELVWREKRIERWLRFGRTADERIIDRRTRFVGLAPDSVFAFVRWAANEHGTVLSRIDILRCVTPGCACSTVPGVTPGGEILLRLASWSKVVQVLRLVDGIEAAGVDPADAAPDYWAHVQNRIAAGQAPRAYTAERHHAWLLRRELLQ